MSILLLDSINKPVNKIYPWTTSNKLFYSANKPITWKGFSAFRLLNLFSRGQDISSYLKYFKEYNIARVWTSVTWDNGWDYPSNEMVYDFLEFMKYKGYQVELTLCTDAKPDRVEQASSLIKYLEKTDIDNLLIEAVNEPFLPGRENEKLDPVLFKSLLESSRFLYTSGIYTNTLKSYGKYWVDHSSRDIITWAAKGGHNCYEACYAGDGPNNPSEVALHIPCVQDEPIKSNEANNDLINAYAYAASCVMLGAGATCHFESGKQCTIPSTNEVNWINAFAFGLNIFPPIDYYRYNRIIEPGQAEYARTYVNGDYSVRIYQKGIEHPEQGWNRLDDYGICWSR